MKRGRAILMSTETEKISREVRMVKLEGALEIAGSRLSQLEEAHRQSANALQSMAKSNAVRVEVEKSLVLRLEQAEQKATELQARLDRAAWYIIGLLITMLGTTIGWIVTYATKGT
jgi:hypothetical protein